MKKWYHATILLLCIASVFMLDACKSSSHSVAGNEQKYSDIANPPSNKHSDEGNNTKLGKELVKEARKWLGTKYSYGGTSKKGVDCSGLVSQVYLKVCNLKLPRSAREQQEYCRPVKKGHFMVGDLIFFATGKNKKAVSHVGLYIGNGKIIHASSSQGVIISNLNDSYYTRTYHSAGRVVTIGKAKKTDKKKSKKGTSAQEIETKTEDVQSDSENTTAPVVNLDNLIEEKIDSIYSN